MPNKLGWLFSTTATHTQCVALNLDGNDIASGSGQLLCTGTVHLCYKEILIIMDMSCNQIVMQAYVWWLPSLTSHVSCGHSRAV